ncbi:MAG: transporter [Flavobacteriaceae bacterium]|nr:transporter [Flavobacteriaceae bacterium]
MKYLPVLFLIILFGIETKVIAQDTEETSELITDRPDATESPNTVPIGSFQIETGGFYTSFEETIDGNKVKQEVLGYNTTLIRYGILDNLEFRLGWNFEEGQTTINGTKLMNVASGFSPLLVGMKVNIVQENGWLPTIGLLGHLYLPVSAGNDYKPQTTGADFRFSFDHSLSPKSGLGYNIGAQWGDDSPEVAYVYTLVYGYSATDKFGLYAEVYGDLPENNSANHFWDAGLTYLLTPNLQIDVTIGSSITNGQDLLLAAGVSYRILK